jgi:hypothetical protein
MTTVPMADVTRLPVRSAFDRDRLWLGSQLASLEAERASLLAALRRVAGGAINQLDHDIAAVQRQLEEHR